MIVMLLSFKVPLALLSILGADLTFLRNEVMELELGLKITQTRDDISSTADLRIARGGGGIVFLSRETDNMFILTAHLEGYRKEHIDIKINEDGTRITISGNKAVQEKVLLGWILYKKEVELRGFRKAFKIPGGVVLDKVKAKFDEDGVILTVFMPKMVQGVSGHVIEEVEEPEDHTTKTDEHEDNATKKMKEVDGDKEGGVNLRELQAQVAAADAPKAKHKEPIEDDTEKQESGVIEEPQIKYPHDGVEQQTKEEVGEAARESELPHTSSASQQLPAEGPAQRPLQKEDTKMGAHLTKSEGNQQPGKVETPQIAYVDSELTEGECPRQEETSDVENEVQSEDLEDDKHREVSENTALVKSKKICVPVVAGSALLVSLIVLVIHWIRAKR